MEESILGIAVLREIPGCIMIGKVKSQNESGVYMTHLTMATSTGVHNLEAESVLTPAVLPLGEMGDGFGEACVSYVLYSNTILFSTVPIVENSPHKLVAKFLTYWDLES